MQYDVADSTGSRPLPCVLGPLDARWWFITSIMRCSISDSYYWIKNLDLNVSLAALFVFHIQDHAQQDQVVFFNEKKIYAYKCFKKLNGNKRDHFYYYTLTYSSIIGPVIQVINLIAHF